MIRVVPYKINKELGSSVSGFCHVGVNTIIHGAFGGNTSLGIPFSSVKSPSHELFVPLISNSSLINIIDINTNNNNFTEWFIILS